MKRTFINLAVVFGTLLVFGILKVPFEIKMEEEMREKDLLPPKIELTDRNSIGQAGYAATLGGFRDVLASYHYLKAYNLHAQRDWYEMERTLNTVVTLQPRSPHYWEMASWQLAYNTFSLTKRNNKLSPTERYTLSKEYITRGDDFLQRGLSVLPGDYDISRERVRLFTDTFRFPDYQVAIDTAAEMLKHGDKMSPNEKLLGWGDYVYALGAEEGNDYNTYLELKKLYSELNILQRVPTQRILLYVLQNSLMIPIEDRIPEEDLLFNSENLKQLNDIYNYEAKVTNTDEATLRHMLTSLQNAWKNIAIIDKTDLLRMKIYILQTGLKADGEDVIDDEELFVDEEHKQIVLKKLEYRSLVDQAEGKAKEVHKVLAAKILSGEGGVNEKELMALIQLKYEEEIGKENFHSWGKLLLTKKDIFKELRNYWNARNALCDKRLLGDVEGIKTLPMGNVLERIRQLEEEMDIELQYRVSNKEDYTSRSYPARAIEN